MRDLCKVGQDFETVILPFCRITSFRFGSRGRMFVRGVSSRARDLTGLVHNFISFVTFNLECLTFIIIFIKIF